MENIFLEKDRFIWDGNRSSRKKRFIGAIGASLSLGGIILLTVNLWETHTQQTSLKQLAAGMTDTIKTGKFLEQGTQVLDHRLDAVQSFCITKSSMFGA